MCILYYITGSDLILYVFKQIKNWRNIKTTGTLFFGKWTDSFSFVNLNQVMPLNI